MGRSIYGKWLVNGNVVYVPADSTDWTHGSPDILTALCRTCTKHGSGHRFRYHLAGEHDTSEIDVLITPSGLYRDTFPYQLELIDKAVRTVTELNESNKQTMSGGTP